MTSDRMIVPPLDIDSSSTMDISDLNEFFSPDWTDIEISPFTETEIIAVATGTTTTTTEAISPDIQSCSTFGKLKKELDADDNIMEADLKPTVRRHDYGSSKDIVVSMEGGIASMQDRMTLPMQNQTEELDHSSSTTGATTTGEFKCNKCSKTFRYKSKYNHHMLIHSGVKQFSCSVCGKSFALKHHLKDHARTHKREKPFKCQVCSKKFCDKNYFTLHVLKHGIKATEVKLDNPGGEVQEKNVPRIKEEEEVDDGDDTCITDDDQVLGSNRTEFSKTMNDKSFKTISRGDDDDNEPFSCDICSKSFKVKGQLVKHVLIHSKRIPCLVCSKVYLQRELSLHMKTAHSDSKPFKCDACSKCFRKKSQLNQHLLYHKGQAPHSCHICDKKFTQRVTLARHIHTHEGNKPFKCQLCYKSFTLKSNLKEHLVTHSGLKRFTCDICEKNFSRKGDLMKHNQSHLVDKPHLCEHCGKRFSRNYNLKLHYRNYHPEVSSGSNGSNGSNGDI